MASKKPVERKLKFTRATEIEEAVAEFLVPKRVPRGALTILAGMPDKGKTFWLCEIAACITRGDAGFNDGKPARVCMTSTEDSVRHVLRPRLRAAGAVLDNVDFVSLQLDDDDGGTLRFPDDLQAFANGIAENDYRLVTIDPILGHINSSVMSSFKDEQLRDNMMTPLAQIAEANDCAIVGCMHLNKRAEGEALLRVSGSLGGIVGPARSMVMLHSSPEDETQRILTHEKSNLGPKGQALVYEFETVQLEIKGRPSEQAHLRWIGKADYSGDELLSGSKETPAAVQEAVEFLRAELADGPRDSKEVRELAKEQGISIEHALTRAKKVLGVVSHKSDFTGGWVMALPDLTEPKIQVKKGRRLEHGSHSSHPSKDGDSHPSNPSPKNTKDATRTKDPASGAGSRTAGGRRRKKQVMD